MQYIIKKEKLPAIRLKTAVAGGQGVEAAEYRPLEFGHFI